MQIRRGPAMDLQRLGKIGTARHGKREHLFLSSWECAVLFTP